MDTHEIRFMALGGGQEVGASCYFLQIDQNLILLDCGKKIVPGGLIGPNFLPLLQPPFLESLSQIHQIFISHSHYDHMGNLPAVAAQCAHAGIYATPVTKALARYMLWDIGPPRALSKARQEQEEIITAAAVDRIIPAAYCQPISFPSGGYRATFYEAGHIPGAAMIHIQIGEKNILYTGDFSCGETALTFGYAIPDSVKADIMIVCGLHAKHPDFAHTKRFWGQMRMAGNWLREGKSVHLHSTQLTKGLEILMMINTAMAKGFPRRNVYIDESILALAEKMESLHMPVLQEGNYRAGAQLLPNSIFIGKRPPMGFQTMQVDFSLHPGYMEVKALINHFHPKTVVLVHTGPSLNPAYENVLETELLSRPESPTKVIYAENGQNYVL